MIAGEQLVHLEESEPTRCPECGRLSANHFVCGACGHELAGQPAEATITVSPSLTDPQATEFPLTGGIQYLPELTTRSLSFPTISRPGPISGRVLMVMPAAPEPIDPDPWKWIAVPLWCGLLLASPFLGGLFALQAGGWLAAGVVFLVLASLVRVLFSSHLFWSWQTVAALRGRHLVEMMPVVTLRLRVGEDEEVQLRLKGHTEGGAVSAGDRVEATGKWRSGVLRVRELRCLRTGATLRPVQPSAFPWAIAGLVILGLTFVWVRWSFIPWLESLPISH